MKVLLTGAAGFIGSHLAEALLTRGDSVVGVDNFDPFYDRSFKRQNLEPLAGRAGWSFEELDICDGPAAARVFQGRGPFDAVVHLAAKAGVRPSIADPAGYQRVNVGGTVAMLEAASAVRPAPRFVFASSSSVYGNAPKTPFAETDNVDYPISPYAATKKAGELLCYTYHHLRGLPMTCLRFFTVYGPRQRPDLAIYQFTRRMLAREPIEMFGDGSASRDYTYIDDIVAGVTAAVDRCKGYEIVNLGSERPVALRDMIETVAGACGVEPVVTPKPMQPGDVERTFADVSKASRLLGYRPAMPFDQGVRRFVEWFRKCRQSDTRAR